MKISVIPVSGHAGCTPGWPMITISASISATPARRPWPCSKGRPSSHGRQRCGASFAADRTWGLSTIFVGYLTISPLLSSPMRWRSVRAAKVMEGYRATRDAPCVGWVLAGSRIDKAYPGSAAVIGRLLERGLNVIMFGAPGKEFLMAKEIERQVVQIAGADKRKSAAGLHLCMSSSIEEPNWPIRRSLSQLQLCDLVVSPDTGPAWSVAMKAMPKVILTSHASPLNITHKWINTVALHADQEVVSCSPCHQLHDRWDTCNRAKDVEAAACMADVPVNLIVEMVVHMLEKGESGHLGDSPRVTWS